jgi:sulfite oxidase
MRSAPPLGKHRDFVVRSVSPFNGGPSLTLLASSFLTPTAAFFVRNHGEVPAVSTASFRLTVDGLVERPLRLTLAELLRDFPRREVTATLECAGNRRQELAAVAPIPGELPWGPEAIGTARWAGVALADVLAAARPSPLARHVAFCGLDEVEREGGRFGFGGSIPLAKALSAEVLLAVEMNGEALPPAHGFPLRALVPGYIGARSVKWLGGITVRERPSDNYFQARAYRLFPPQVKPPEVAWDEGLALGEVPVNCIVCRPAAGAAVPAGRVRVAGVAFAGGGRAVARVDLSADGGGTWTSARLFDCEEPWAWRLWEGEVELAAGVQEVVARAWDTAAQTQPEDAAKLWNFKGYVNNAWYRVRLHCTPVAR